MVLKILFSNVGSETTSFDIDISHWTEESGIYTFKEDIVTIISSEGGTADFLYDRKG